MHPRSPARCAVAMIAAYALALQAIVAGVAVTPAADVAGLCLSVGHDVDDGSGRAPPKDHAGCAVCALSCGALVPPRRSERSLDGMPPLSTGTGLPWQLAQPPAASPRLQTAHARAPPRFA